MRAFLFALLIGSASASPLQPLFEQLRVQDLQRGAWALQQGEQVEQGRIDEGPPDAEWRIGSISKMFTAVLVLQLVDEGKLRLDEPLSRWFPKLPDAEHTTVEMLLAHRSGLGDVKHAPDFDAWARQPRSEAELLALIEALPRQAPPGVRAEYNNSGFILLHWIVERVSGQRYEQRLAERIAAPLKLHHTRMAVEGEGLGSWRWDDGQWQPMHATHPSVPRGAGALVSTPAELTRFIRALCRGELLKPETLVRMTKLQDGYGLGIVKSPVGKNALGHEGVIDGFRSALVYLPEQDLAAAVLLHAERWPRDALLRQLLDSRLQKDFVATDLRPQPQDWALRAELPALQPGQRLALRGSLPPLSWQRGIPFDGAELALRWTGVAGLPLEAKLVVEDAGGEVVRWERGDNRRWLPGAAPALLRFDVKGETEQLWSEILAADRAMFDAFNRGDAGALGAYFSERLEFFHDLGGLSGKTQSLQQLARNFGRRDLKLRRELRPEGLQIFPLPGVGAMQIGRHRFCRSERGEAEQCSDFGFSTVWEKTASGWQQLRVLSYGH
jgi:D-alanyl-D-alanine carboxypeptidase